LAWFEKAAKADPNYDVAHAGMAYVYAYEIVILGLSPSAATRGISRSEKGRTSIIKAGGVSQRT
jgi:hypothetical protein